MIYTNKLTSKGQVTIPKEFRDKLGLGKAGRASFTLNEHGQVVIERPVTIADVHKKLAHPSKSQPLTAKEEQIIRGMRADGDQAIY